MKHVKVTLTPAEAYAAVIKAGNLQHRGEQQEMVDTICRAWDQDAVHLAEMGTGTGKTLVYLTAAARHCLGGDKRRTVVIATPTKQLQMQALSDAEHVKRVFPDLRVCLLKGKRNYFSRDRILAKIDQATSEELRDDVLGEFYQSLLSVADNVLGDIDQLPSWITSNIDMINAQRAGTDEEQVDLDALAIRAHAKDEDMSYYLAAKGRAKDADIVITNHSFWGISVRMAINSAVGAGRKKGTVKPAGSGPLTSAELMQLMEELRADISVPFSADYCLIDEGHMLARNLEQMMSSDLALSVLRINIRLLRKALTKLTSDPQIIKLVDSAAERALKSCIKAIERISAIGEQASDMISLDSSDSTTRDVLERIRLLSGAMDGLIKSIERLHKNSDKRRLAALRQIHADLADAQQVLAEITGHFFGKGKNGAPTSHYFLVRFSAEKRYPSILSVVPSIYWFAVKLWQAYKGVCIVSGTLADMSAGGAASEPKFSYARKKLGLTGSYARQDVDGRVIKGPLRKNINVFAYEDLPLYDYEILQQKSAQRMASRSASEIDEIIAAGLTNKDVEQSYFASRAIRDAVKEIVSASATGTLMLTNSHAQTVVLADIIERMRIPGVRVLAHMSRDKTLHSCITEFEKKSDEKKVLISAGAWMGVDIDPAAMQDLVIVRMPYDSLAAAIWVARFEQLKRSFAGKGNPITPKIISEARSNLSQEMSAEAAIRFRQGCGRIGRNPAAVGNIHILDSRLLKSPYLSYRNAMAWLRATYRSSHNPAVPANVFIVGKKVAA